MCDPAPAPNHESAGSQHNKAQLLYRMIRPTLEPPTQQTLEWAALGSEAVLWHSPFPERVQDKLDCFRNITWMATSLDLELAATIAHQHLL